MSGWMGEKEGWGAKVYGWLDEWMNRKMNVWTGCHLPFLELV